MAYSERAWRADFNQVEDPSRTNFLPLFNGLLWLIGNKGAFTCHIYSNELAGVLLLIRLLVLQLINPLAILSYGLWIGNNIVRHVEPLGGRIVHEL